MSFAAYQSFIDQFCEQAGLPEPRAMYHDAAFRIGNTDFTLRHGGANAPEMAMIYCALGGLPPAGPQREAALMGLLDSNLQLFGSGSNPTFAFNADNQQAMLMCGIWLGQASGLSVLELLTRFDMLAHEWRSSYFVGGQLNADGTPQTAASRSQRGLPPHLARAFNAGQVA